MSDMGEVWKELRQEQKERRQKRLGPNSDEILFLREAGFIVEKLTEYQYRVDGVVDFYPIHRRFHVLRTGRRGSYHDVESCVNKLVAEGRIP